MALQAEGACLTPVPRLLLNECHGGLGTPSTLKVHEKVFACVFFLGEAAGLSQLLKGARNGDDKSVTRVCKPESNPNPGWLVRMLTARHLPQRFGVGWA